MTYAGFEKNHAVEMVERNNKSTHPILKPLLNCPEMIDPEACAVCFWHDRDLNVCRGG